VVDVLTLLRRRWVVAVCAVAIAAGVLFTGARAWATSHSPARCRPPAAATRVGPPTHRGAEGGWRVHALRAAGCGAWHRMRQRMHHH
jgi:hypothetical protein